jgi:hypothetical protein
MNDEYDDEVFLDEPSRYIRDIATADLGDLEAAINLADGVAGVLASLNDNYIELRQLGRALRERERGSERVRFVRTEVKRAAEAVDVAVDAVCETEDSLRLDWPAGRRRGG